MQRQLSTLSVASVRGYQVREEATAYDGNPIDPDPDSDLDESKLRPVAGPYGSREGDEAVVYMYVNGYGYGDEGPHEPCRSADCMALTGCMSHPQF